MPNKPKRSRSQASPQIYNRAEPKLMAVLLTIVFASAVAYLVIKVTHAATKALHPAAAMEDQNGQTPPVQ
jgi:2-polyprenyl-3-methyl-5-hydroxy-6-metoxy-1,4-benzoquinol methylase